MKEREKSHMKIHNNFVASFMPPKHLSPKAESLEFSLLDLTYEETFNVLQLFQSFNNLLGSKFTYKEVSN